MPRPIPTATLRRLAADHDVDPRSILRELRAPGSVCGMAGERCRAALRALAATRAGATPGAAAGRQG
jgi:hypothetical protein